MGNDLSGLRIQNAPAAFAEFARKHNDLVDLIAGIKGSNGITPFVSYSPRPKRKAEVGKPREQPPSSFVLSINPGALSGLEIGAGGLPTGYTYEEFTICVSGTPETRWWPTWLTDPS